MRVDNNNSLKIFYQETEAKHHLQEIVIILM